MRFGKIDTDKRNAGWRMKHSPPSVKTNRGRPIFSYSAQWISIFRESTKAVKKGASASN